jgi:hypothetical protein
MPRFLIHVTTAWCGMDQDYAAIANNEEELEDIAQNAAYDNFADFDCLEQAIEDEYPDVDSDDITDEMKDVVIEKERDYYGYSIEPWDEERPEEEWGWYELRWDLIGDSEDAKV